jgi:hypothetical protein
MIQDQASEVGGQPFGSTKGLNFLKPRTNKDTRLNRHGRACLPWRVSPCWRKQRHESASTKWRFIGVQDF